jgi:hypothetical protein
MRTECTVWEIEGCAGGYIMYRFCAKAKEVRYLVDFVLFCCLEVDILRYLRHIVFDVRQRNATRRNTVEIVVMKLQAILAGLATLAAATSDSSPAADSSSTTTATDPTPVGALWTSTWNTTTLSPYSTTCRTSTTHHAQIYKLSALYPDLEDFAPQLKVFYNKQAYPGSWSGIDAHGGERELMRMDMAEVPVKVREWIKREKDQRHYSVHDDVVFFAPGAVYPILPLWVEGRGKECEGEFSPF